MTSCVNFEQPFKILHLCSSIGLKSGGLGPVVLGFAKEQRAVGHHTAIWCFDSPSEIQRIARENSLPAEAVTRFPVLGPTRIGFSPAMEHAATCSVGGLYDIVHQHNIWTGTTRVTNRWRFKFHRPTVVSPHGTLEEFALGISKWKKRLALIAYERTNLRMATCLHATAESEAESFRRLGLRNPIAVISNGIPDVSSRDQCRADRFRERFSIAPGCRMLLFLSRLHQKKGLPMLFEALANLPSLPPDWLLVVAGFEDSPGYLCELKNMAKNLCIAERVVFAGALYGSDKQDAFAAADLFLLPSHSENFGIVVAEALGACVPVLTTRGTPWEELTTYDCGWWVEISSDAIRNALQDFFHRSKEELISMGQRGKNLVIEKYLWRSLAEKMIYLYFWILGQCEKPGFVLTCNE